MISGIGTDIIEINRVDHAHRTMGWAFIHQVLGQNEIEVFSELIKENTFFHRPTATYLARRFAAKEAFIKAYGSNKVDFREVQILNEKEGAPYLHYTGEVGEVMNVGKWKSHVTISDNDTTVVATVILEIV